MIQSEAKHKKIAIVGAGFSGLTLAYHLIQLQKRNPSKNNYSIEIFEKTNRVGGLIGTQKTTAGLYETAANAMMRSPSVEKLLQDLQIETASLLKTSKKRFIWRNQLQRWPLTLLETFYFLLRFLPKFIFDREKLHPLPEETISQWGKRNLTPSVSYFLMETGLQGIYGSNTKDLSASLILGPLFQKKRQRYKGLVAPKKGMQELIDKLEEALRHSHVKIHFGSTEIPNDFTHTVICLNAQEAASWIQSKSPSLGHQLRQIKMQNKTSITLFYEHFPTKSSYKGFGCLIPPENPKFLDRSEALLPLGILMNSFIFSDRDQLYNETWIFSEIPSEIASDGDYFLRVREKIVGEKIPINSIKVTTWTPALPFYDVALEKMLKEIKTPPGIYLHGNYLGKIGLTGILDRSIQLAKELADE